MYLILSQSTRNQLSFSPLFLSLSFSFSFWGQRDVKDYGKTSAEREDSDKNTSVLAARAVRGERDSRNRERRRTSASRVSWRMRFDKLVVSFNPWRTPASDYTGCVSMACTWSLTRARTGPKPRLYVCERADITPCGTPPHPCLSQRLFLSPRAGRYSRAIFRILPRDTSNVQCRSWDFAQMYGKFASHGSYTRNWERAMLKFVTVFVCKTHPGRLDTVFDSIDRFKNYRENKLSKLFSFYVKKSCRYLYFV